MPKSQIKKKKELPEMSLPPDVDGHNALYSSGRQSFQTLFTFLLFYYKAAAELILL